MVPYQGYSEVGNIRNYPWYNSQVVKGVVVSQGDSEPYQWPYWHGTNAPPIHGSDVHRAYWHGGRLIQPAHHPITSHQAAGRRNKTIVRRRQDIERYIGSPIFLHHCCIWLPWQQSFRGCCDKNRACRESILINMRTLAGICDQRGGQMEELHTRWPGNKQGDREKIPPVTFCSKCSICGCVHLWGKQADRDISP